MANGAVTCKYKVDAASVDRRSDSTSPEERTDSDTFPTLALPTLSIYVIA